MVHTWPKAGACQQRTHRVRICQPPLRHLILFLACVVLPALFTTVAPLSVIHFDRASDGTISARASTRCFFIIPFRHVRIDDVATVSDRLSDGTLNRTGFSGSRRSVQSETAPS
jgi:hypothetical protein